jgi:hypothetical protein
MAKPILVVKMQKGNDTSEHLNKLNNRLSGKCGDYHVFVVPGIQEEVMFEVYNVGNIPETQIEDFKKLVMDSLSPNSLD